MTMKWQPSATRQVGLCLWVARHTVAQDNTPVTNNSDLSDEVRKAVWAMTEEERLAFRKAAKDMEQFVKTKHVYRPPPLASVRGSDKAPRTAATVSVRAEVPETPPVTETDGDGTGVVAPCPTSRELPTTANGARTATVYRGSRPSPATTLRNMCEAPATDVASLFRPRHFTPRHRDYDRCNKNMFTHTLNAIYSASRLANFFSHLSFIQLCEKNFMYCK